jgi:restriction system protein
MIFPQVRQALLAIGFIAFFVLVVLVVGLIGFGVYRIAAGSQQAQTIERNVGWKALGVDVVSKQKQPRTTADLIEELRTIHWFQFETLVALVYRRSGYTVIRRGGANPDGGIDLLIEKEDQRSAVQCKHWKTGNVGVKAMREFLGALTDTGIRQGIFITLCGYTGEAKQLAEKHGIEIVNETGLATMVEATGALLDPELLAILSDSRKFCPKCEAEMVLRTATRGMGAGRQFWGCSAYPRCRFTMPS